MIYWSGVGVLGGLQIIMCYVNFRVFNSGKSKNDLYLRVIPTPLRAPSGGRLGGPTWGVESYTTEYHVLCQFWDFQ